LARVLQHHLDTGGIHHVADLVTVAENRRGAVEERRLRIGAGRDHAALDVDVRVDETRGDDAAHRIIHPARCSIDLAIRTGRLHGCDASSRDPELPLRCNTFAIGRKHTGARNHEIGGGPTGSDIREASGHHRQGSDGKAGQRRLGRQRSCTMVHDPSSRLDNIVPG
jgi:hypothetical protein